MASGNTLGWWDGSHYKPITANYATFTSRNGMPLIVFDGTTAQAAALQGVLPDYYSDTTGVTLDIYWAAATATSGGVVWGVSMERNNAGNRDLDADAFATEVTGSGTANATCGKLTKTSIALTKGTNMNSAVAGDPFRLQIVRKTADGSDDMTGSAQIAFVVMRET